MSNQAGSCPRCRVVLTQAHLGDIALEGCTRCGGLWLDFGTTGRVLSAMHEGALDLADRAAYHASVRADTSGAEIVCPACGGVMARMHLGGTNVEVDRCMEHGTWFDRDELRQAAEQVARARRGSPDAAVVAVAGAAGAAGAVGIAAMAADASGFFDGIDKTELVVDGVEVGAEVFVEAMSGDVGGSVLSGAIGLFGILLGALGD